MLPQIVNFSSLKKRQIQADFNGGHITSDAGLLLLREVDKNLQLSARLANCIEDKRKQGKVRHGIQTMTQQRMLAVAAGYEDLNDHQSLRYDFALQTAAGTDQTMASTATLQRLEASIDRQTIIRAHHLLWQQYVDQHKVPPKQVILDFDATDIPLHGDQPDKFFHGYYDHYCYLPLYVFAGRFPLVAYLRPSRADGAKHAAAILRLLVSFLRTHWPDVQIIFRGDSGFCRARILAYCERYKVDYIVGIARNSRLEAITNPFMKHVENIAELRQKKGEPGRFRHYTDFHYAAKSWPRMRRIIAKVEVTEKGRNPRYLVSTLEGEPDALYRDVYCARGDMENRIKDQQMDLFAGRTSCRRWWSNQWRLMLSVFSYLLFEGLRGAITHPLFKKMSVGNLRLKLIKIGAVMLRNTRRIRCHLSEAYPYKDIFRQVARAITLA